MKGKKMSQAQIQKELDDLDIALESMSQGGIEYDRAMDHYSELKERLKEDNRRKQ